MQGLVLGGLPLPSGAAEPPYQTPVRKGKAGEEGDSSGGERHKRKGSGRGVLGHTRTHTHAHTQKQEEISGHAVQAVAVDRLVSYS